MAAPSFKDRILAAGATAAAADFLRGPTPTSTRPSGASDTPRRSSPGGRPMRRQLRPPLYKDLKRGLDILAIYV